MNNISRPRSKLGSKRKLKDGRWEIRVSHGYTLEGKQRTVREVLDSEKEADTRIVELAAEMGKKPDINAGLTLRMLWALYKVDKGKRLANMTMDGYKRVMKGVWLPILGDEDVSRINRQRIQEELLKFTPGKAQSSKRVLSSVLTYAVNEGLLSKNPMLGASFEMPGDTGSEWANEKIWDGDPFAVIEGKRDVWDAATVLKAFPRMRGLPLEPVWLAMVGGGLRLEEAFALRPIDLRRIEIGGREVTQVAVHHARTALDERKRTKTDKSVRIMAVMDPFGERLWELAQQIEDKKSLICNCDPMNQNKRWHGYFEALEDEPDKAKHRPKKEGLVFKASLKGLPYIPLSRMRATHSTLMQEAGVPDSLNAQAHGHSKQVAHDYYMRADTTAATEQTRRYLELVG